MFGKNTYYLFSWFFFFLCSDTFIHTFMLQIAVLSNHLNGRDTHIRQIKIYGPRPYAYVFYEFHSSYLCLFLYLFHLKSLYFRNPVPNLPFHFTSKDFITYSTIRWWAFKNKLHLEWKQNWWCIETLVYIDTVCRILVSPYLQKASPVKLTFSRHF